MKSKPTIKKLEEMMVASTRQNLPVWEIGKATRELSEYCEENGIDITGSPFAIYYDIEFDPDDADVEVCYQAVGPFANSGEVRNRILPGGRFATIVHTGSYERVGESYQQLFEYRQNKGERLIGPRREVYLVGPHSGKDASAYETELQFPLL
jgi:effector-binding domain-containing protein